MSSLRRTRQSTIRRSRARATDGGTCGRREVPQTVPRRSPLAVLNCVLALAIVATSVQLALFSPPAAAYDGRCPVVQVLTGRETWNPLQHYFIELVIRDDIGDELVKNDGPFSDVPGLPASVVDRWRVEPPTNPLIGKNHHWRIVMDTTDWTLTYPWLFPLYLSNPREIAYLRCSMPDPPAPPAQQPLKLSAELSPALRKPSEAVCFTSSTEIAWNGNPIYLSSRGDQLQPVAIDDALELYVRYPDGQQSATFRHESFTQPFGPVELSSYLRAGVRNTVVLRVLDRVQPECGGSAVWLVWDGGISPPNEEPFRLLDNLAIREAPPSAQLRFPLEVPGWMRYLRMVLRKGSDAKISLEAPDGSRYTPESTNVTYVNSPGYAISAVSFDRSTPGTWVAVVDVISTSPESVFYLSVIGKQGEIAATDTISPTTTIQVAGSQGQHGWYTSDVTVSLSAQDDPGGSGVQRIEWSLDGAVWQPYTDSFVIGREGTSRLHVRAVDAAGNVEQLPSSALIRVDKSLPSVSGSATCARDALGVCRNTAILRFSVTDEVSGPQAVRVRVNGGDWITLSSLQMIVSESGLTLEAELPLPSNGRFRVEAVGQDWAGLLSPTADFGTVTVEKYLVVSTAPGRSWRALSTTATQYLGERSHTNGSVDIYSNSSLFTELPVEIVSGGNRVSYNTSTTFRSEGSSVAVAAPSYSFEYYAALPGVSYYSTSRTFNSTTPLCGLHVVDGDITLTNVVPKPDCGLTFVAKGKLTDRLSDVTLKAADPTTGALYVAFGSVTPLTIYGNGKTLSGMVAAPNGAVLIKANNSTIDGSVVGSTVEVNGTSKMVFRWGTQVATARYALPLAPATYVPSPPAITDGAPRLVSPVHGEVVATPVTFHWEALSGATAYTVVISNSATFSGGTTISKTLSGATSTSVSLMSGTTWYWHVRMAGPAVGPWSETRSIRT